MDLATTRFIYVAEDANLSTSPVLLSFTIVMKIHIISNFIIVDNRNGIDVVPV